MLCLHLKIRMRGHCLLCGSICVPVAEVEWRPWVSRPAGGWDLEISEGWTTHGSCRVKVQVRCRYDIGVKGCWRNGIDIVKWRWEAAYGWTARGNKCRRGGKGHRRRLGSWKALGKGSSNQKWRRSSEPSVTLQGRVELELNGSQLPMGLAQLGAS